MEAALKAQIQKKSSLTKVTSAFDFPHLRLITVRWTLVALLLFVYLYHFIIPSMRMYVVCTFCERRHIHPVHPVQYTHTGLYGECYIVYPMQ